MASANRKGLDFKSNAPTFFSITKIQLRSKNFTSKTEFQSHNDNFHSFKVSNLEVNHAPNVLFQSKPRRVLYNELNCHYCNIKFENRDELDAHMVSKHRENPYHCLICGKGVSFPKRDLLRRVFLLMLANCYSYPIPIPLCEPIRG